MLELPSHPRRHMKGISASPDLRRKTRNRNFEEKILDRVDRNADEIVSFVQEIIRIPSVTGNESEVGQAIFRKMKSMGLEAEIVEGVPGRPNVCAVLNGARKGKRLLFNGHMDVVPPGPREEWEFPPFSGIIRDGRLHGRGTVDMKSGTCASILAVEAIMQSGVSFGGSIALTAVCDEEVGGALGTRLLIQKGFIGADMGINCEATNLKTVDIAHKGIYTCEITVQGKAIHGSRPWLGINAIDKATAIVERINALGKSLEARKHPLLRFPTVNVGTIHGGTVVNMIPSKCVLEVNRRLVPGETFEGAERELREILEELSARDPGFRASLKGMEFRMPILDVSPESGVVNAIRKAHKTVRGEDLPVGGKDAGTDASWIVQATGMPMPIYGPGDYLRGSLAANESIEIRDIVDAVKVYALAAYYMLGEGECGKS